MEILNWFVTQQLAEYRELYEPSQAVAWLDKIDHRYAWLRTNLTPLERKIRTLFPQEWLVLERLVVLNSTPNLPSVFGAELLKCHSFNLGLAVLASSLIIIDEISLRSRVCDSETRCFPC